VKSATILNLHYLVHSEPGDGHANEDLVTVRPHPGNADVLLCCLADGQGGQSGGASAARVAVEESLRAASSFPADELREEALWHAIVGAADEAVCEDAAAGYCSLVSLCISAEGIWGASCGDSGALLLSGGRDILLTDAQRKNPPVGSSAARPTAFSARLAPGWRLLVVSDGVWKYVGWESIAQIAARGHGPDLIAALRRAALESNGGRLQDDFSVALLYGDGDTGKIGS